MKTAKDILNLFSNPLVILLSDEDKIQLMKEYAHQVAINALKDAAERATLRVESIFGHKCTSINLYSDPDGDTISIDKESITKTKIETP